MGCNSSVGEAKGEVEGDEDVRVEAGDEGENDDEWVVRVIYGIPDDVEEDESSSSPFFGEYEHLSSNVTLLRLFIVRVIGGETYEAKSCKLEVAERTGMNEP